MCFTVVAYIIDVSSSIAWLSCCRIHLRNTSDRAFPEKSKTKNLWELKCNTSGRVPTVIVLVFPWTSSGLLLVLLGTSSFPLVACWIPIGFTSADGVTL